MNYNVKSELRRSMDAIHFSGDDKERMVALLMSAEAPRQRRSGKKLPPNMKMTGIRQRLGMVS